MVVDKIVDIVNTLLLVYNYMILAYILMSWFPNARESGIGQFLGKMVEPYLSIFRRFIPPIGMLDISPIVAFIALRFIGSGLIFLIELIANMF